MRQVHYTGSSPASPEPNNHLTLSKVKGDETRNLICGIFYSSELLTSLWHSLYPLTDFVKCLRGLRTSDNSHPLPSSATGRKMNQGEKYPYISTHRSGLKHKEAAQVGHVGSHCQSWPSGGRGRITMSLRPARIHSDEF